MWFLKGVSRFASWLKSIIWILCLFMYNFYFSINSVCLVASSVWVAPIIVANMSTFLALFSVCSAHTSSFWTPKDFVSVWKRSFLLTNRKPASNMRNLSKPYFPYVDLNFVQSWIYEPTIDSRNLTFIGYVEWAVPHRRSKTLLGSQVWLC